MSARVTSLFERKQKLWQYENELHFQPTQEQPKHRQTSSNSDSTRRQGLNETGIFYTAHRPRRHSWMKLPRQVFFRVQFKEKTGSLAQACVRRRVSHTLTRRLYLSNSSEVWAENEDKNRSCSMAKPRVLVTHAHDPSIGLSASVLSSRCKITLLKWN